MSSTPLNEYNNLQATFFIDEVLKGLSQHEQNGKIPQNFRNLIPALRTRFEELQAIEDDEQLTSELEKFMSEKAEEMELLDVEDQIYFNMIYNVSGYNNLEPELNSDDEVSVDSQSSDWTTDSEERESDSDGSDRDSEDEDYLEPLPLTEARDEFNRINREFVIAKNWSEQADRVLSEAIATENKLSGDTNSQKYNEAQACVDQAREIQDRSRANFEKRSSELAAAKAKYIEELKEYWGGKAGYGTDPLEAYFNNFLEMGEEHEFYETELNQLRFYAISMVFGEKQVSIHKAIFDATQKVEKAEKDLEDVIVKFKTISKQLIDSSDIFCLDQKTELRDARDEYGEAKIRLRRAVIINTYLLETLQFGIHLREVRSTIDWNIDALGRRCTFLYNDACRAKGELKKRYEEDHREAVAKLDSAKELKERVERFKNEDMFIVETDAEPLQDFFTITLEGDNKRDELKGEIAKRAVQEEAQRQRTLMYYTLGGLLCCVTSAAVYIYFARNHESSTALKSCVSSVMDKIASTGIGEFASKMLSSINNAIFR